MSGSKDIPISPDRPAGSAAPKSAVEHFELDVTKVAALVAEGEIEWPNDLTEAQATVLTKAVRELNRSRLINLFARLIAEDIFRGQTSEIDS